MRVLVCGGRSFADYESVVRELDRLAPSVVIHADNHGADQLAKRYAAERSIPSQEFAAEWAKYGPSAGLVNNARMLSDGKPDVVISFPGGMETSELLIGAVRALIRLIVVDESDE